MEFAYKKEVPLVDKNKNVNACFSTRTCEGLICEIIEKRKKIVLEIDDKEK